jgi:hypothetical protein
MEPVSHPEWASPLEVGVHVESFYSALPEQASGEVLRSLCGDPKLLSFLRRHPLGRLEFSGRLPHPSWRGLYDPLSRDVVVNPFRGPETYGKQFYPPELPTVSEAGRNLVEAIERSLYHEIGHSVLDAAGPELDRQVRRLFRSGRAIPVSLRAMRNLSSTFAKRSPLIASKTGLRTRTPVATI